MLNSHGIRAHALPQFYRKALRKKLYRSIKGQQADLGGWVPNDNTTHPNGQLDQYAF